MGISSFCTVTNKITVTIFTVVGGVGALGFGEALENRVWPLVEGGELKGMEGADTPARACVKGEERTQVGFYRDVNVGSMVNKQIKNR